MPKRKRSAAANRSINSFKRIRGGLSRRQASSVRKIARKTALGLSETINAVTLYENQQLVHNKVYYLKNLLETTQGLLDENDGGSAENAVRKGDELILKNINLRFWLSTKKDRPNVIYKDGAFPV